MVVLRIYRALLAVAEIDDLFWFAKIDAAGQFANDHEIEPIDEFALQRRGIRERRIADRRAQIGEEVHILAKPQKTRLGADFIRDGIPFRPAGNRNRFAFFPGFVGGGWDWSYPYYDYAAYGNGC